MNNNHERHHNLHQSSNNNGEYLKFALVMLFIAGVSYVVSSSGDFRMSSYMQSFMAVFFFVFGGFKLIKLREFAYGFQSYDIIAKRSLVYSYSYPFLQLAFGFLYLFAADLALVHIVVLLVSLVSAVGVIKALNSKNKIHCVCLGNVIKLPLSTISFVEDFGMAIMAAAMLLMQA